MQNSAEIANDLSKCSIKEVEKTHIDRTSGVPMSRLPLQVSPSIQGMFPFIVSSGHLFLGFEIHNTHIMAFLSLYLFFKIFFSCYCVLE